MKKTRVAINGFGRIGRIFFRQIFGKPEFEIVAINDLTPADNLAYLLKYDSVYHSYAHPVSVTRRGTAEYLTVRDAQITILHDREPQALPWRELAVDAVIECTGVFDSYEKAKAHLEAGAKRVILSAPSKDLDSELGQTVLMGLNEEALGACAITSNGSCTTNATHPLATIMEESVGVVKGFLNTTHSYTATQGLVDGTGGKNDFRRGRAAGVNMVPSDSGAAIAVTRALPSLMGKFDAVAVRVPTPTVSLADFTFVSKRKTEVAEINHIFIEEAKTPRWHRALATISDPVVSSDIIGTPYGCVVDLSYTKVVGGDLVKVMAWYDNEWGYVTTLVHHLEKVAALL